MRLRRLELARYGKFTDRTIDFGPAASDAPDLHIVYGPNEAGKSTLLSGFLDLLFGIELQSRYGFLHSYETMRVGACLELSDGSHELMRVKKPQPTLRDAHDRPVAQTLLAGALSGLDRVAYRTMFSLDDETLESGGNSILASNGELGQLLFSASAGLAELSQTLLAIRTDADGFAKYRGRAGELQKLKSSLATLKQEREAIDVQAGAYAQLTKTRDDAERDYRVALTELTRQQAELAQLRRLRLGIPRLAAWRALTDKLERYGSLPAVPASWQTELPQLEQQASHHRSATERTGEAVQRLTDALAGLPLDPAAAARSSQVAQLESHRARDLTAQLDLPPRRADLVRTDEAVRRILVDIGRADEPDPRTLLLTVAQAGIFDDLLSQRSGIAATLATANDELVDAAHALATARDRLGPNLAAPAGLALVAAALSAWQSSDHGLRRRAAMKARDHNDDALARGLGALQPWSGDAAVLAALATPSDRIVQEWMEEADHCTLEVARRHEQIEQLETELRPRQADLAALPTPPPDQDGAELRTRREAAWAEHRRTLDAASADCFETALRHDDAAAFTRLLDERSHAQRHATTQAVRLKTAELDAARQMAADAAEARQRYASRLATALAQISPALAPLSAAEVAAWLPLRQTALAAWTQRRDAERDIAEAHADEAELRARLQAALTRTTTAFDPAAPTDTLAVLARETLEREARLDLLRNDVAQCERALRTREPAVEKAARADRAWQAAWQAACADCRLDAAAPVDTVRAILATTAALGPALEKHGDLAGRIRDMEQDQLAFAEAVARLAADLDLPTSGRSSSDLAAALVDRVQSALRAEAERVRLERALAEATDADRAARQAASAHAGRVDEMMRALKASSLLDVADRLRDIREKAELEVQAEHARRELLATLDVADPADAQSLLAGHTDIALEGEEAALLTPLDALEQRIRTLFAAREAAADRIAAVGGDDLVARIEERRRTQLLEIEDKAQHYLRLRIGIAAAERALRAYRDQHRSSMMQQASVAFSLISRGAYTGLATQPGRDGDILVAMAADGGSKLAHDLSKGARFQLYLALRAAGYREFAKLRPTVPFIADDIMETFDDFRAEETLKLLADMARLGQVIYLTHHGHLRDIAERVVPGIRVHELSR
ncbi:MAG: AAA family ATPase [Janthinobacterium lividum]